MASGLMRFGSVSLDHGGTSIGNAQLEPILDTQLAVSHHVLAVHAT